MPILLPPQLFIPATAVPPAITFRLVQPGDESLLYNTFYSQRSWVVFRQHFSRMAHWAERGRCYWVIAERQTSLLATGQVLLYPHGAEIANLQVAAGERRQGIGTALLGILTAVASHLALPYLEISVEQDNSQALALYQRLGFVIERQLELPGGFFSLVLGKNI